HWQRQVKIFWAASNRLPHLFKIHSRHFEDQSHWLSPSITRSSHQKATTGGGGQVPISSGVDVIASLKSGHPFLIGDPERRNAVSTSLSSPYRRVQQQVDSSPTHLIQ